MLVGLVVPFETPSYTRDHVFERGAFSRAIQRDLPVLVDHDHQRQVPGRLSLWEGAAGLFCRFRPYDSDAGYALMAAARRGLIRGMSCAGTIRADRFVNNGRVVTDVDLEEITVAINERPAHPGTWLALEAS